MKRFCNIKDPDDLPSWYEQALKWSPKTRSWRWPIEDSLSAVRCGDKPLVFRYDPAFLRRVAPDLMVRELSSASVSAVAFVAGNECFADFLGWAYCDKYLPKYLRDFAIGVCCGYPIGDVLSYCRLSSVPSVSDILLRRV